MTRVPETHFTERDAVAHVERVVSKGFHWIFRATPHSDVGLDGEIEMVERGTATGRLIKVQIKGGPSYFRSDGGGHFRCPLDGKHLDYFRSANVPIILVVFHPEEGLAYWCDMKAYLRDHPEIADRGAGIRFDRATTRFDETALEAIEALTRPAGGAPAPVPPRCIGRDTLVEKLVRCLSAIPPEPVILLGSAGIGKSCIAARAFDDPLVFERFGRRRFFVRCDGAGGGAELMAAIAREMAMPPGALPGPWVCGELGSAPTLLVLDNLETPWEQDREGTRETLGKLARLGGVALVGTVRGRECPRGVAWRERLEVHALGALDARALFLEVAGEGFRDDPQLAGLLRELDHVPLAVELLARLADGTADLSPIREAWDRQRTALLRDGDEKGRTNDLGASFELSIHSRRMTGVARRLLSVLSGIPDGLNVRDAPAMVEAAAMDAVVPLDKTGLVFREGDRLRMLAPLREHVAQIHPPSSADRARLEAHVFKLVREQGPLVGTLDGASAAARLMPETANLESLLTRALAEPEASAAIDAAVAAKSFFRFSGLGTLELLRRAAQAAKRAGDMRREADAVQAMAEVALARSQYAEADGAYSSALALRGALGDRAGEADALLGLGHLARYRTQPDEAQRLYERALAIALESVDPRNVAHARKSLGHAALARGRADEAAELYEAAREGFLALGDACEVANCVRSLGLAMSAQNHLEEGKRLLSEALPTFIQTGDRRGEADCQRGLGSLAVRRGDAANAKKHQKRAIELYRQVKDTRGEALCLIELGTALRGRDPEAAVCYRTAIELLTGSPSHKSIGLAHAGLAELTSDEEVRRGHVEAANRSWSSIGRHDLVAGLRERLGAGAP